MGLHDIPADLLPAVERIEERRAKNLRLAHSLPHIAWYRIVSHISDHLPTLFTVATFSRDLKDICRPHMSSHFRRVQGPYDTRHAGIITNFYYHRVLQLVLEGYVDPSYIYEVYCWDAHHAPLSIPGLSRPRNVVVSRVYQNDAVYPGETSELLKRYVDRLLREALHVSPWIPPKKESEVHRLFRQGDPDAALAVLLPLCTKMKTLEIPKNSQYSAAVVQAAAQAYHRRGVTGEEARRKAWEAALRDRDKQLYLKSPACDTLPFSELLVLCVQAYHYHQRYSFPLTEMIPFMGLPTLHRIVLGCVRDSTLTEWPTDVVECSSPQIYFSYASVTKEAVAAFAKGLRAPCEIRQWFTMDTKWTDPELLSTGEPDWDRVLIKSSADGNKITQTSLDFDGGYPGYQHGWVSGLFYNEMQDWTRLDEEFSPHKGDELVMELSGL